MVIVLERKISDEQVNSIINKLEDYGFKVHKSQGNEQILLGAIDVKNDFDIRKIKVLDGVSEVYRITEPFKLASRIFKEENTEVKIKDVTIGSDEVIVIAGPCAVEGEEQIFKIAEYVSKAGAKLLRGGAFKPRTSPYSFQGLGLDGLKLMRQAADKYGLLVITEIIEANQIEIFQEYADVLQLGSRNMQNFPLLREIGKSGMPVMIKRGFAATIEEWLMSAEYVLTNGNPNVMLCERGIRTFESSTRNTFDLAAIPVVHKKSHLPVLADPSHATGLRDKVLPMARAAVAAGADGLMVEVHYDPEKALSDGPQALLPDEFTELMKQVKLIAEVIGRRVGA
ncbi:MAG: 3-deoxy-7-phosphoheptulonate synthase [Syntrophothermus sp.]